jgi:hypothetical protein
MLKKLIILLPGVLLLFLSSCEEKTGIMEQPVSFSIQPVSVPARISVSKVKTYSISFRVTHPEGLDAIDSVWATFLGSNQSIELETIALFDDGSIDYPADGDVIAKDGVFTNTFQSDSTVFPLGDVFIQATALDKNQQQRQTNFIESRSLLNAPPVLAMASVPDTLPSGSPTLLFSVTVQDSNDIDDVTGVFLRLKRGGSTITTTPLSMVNSTAADSGTYGAFFDSSFAAEREGDYDLEFQAVDLSGDSSQVLIKTIYLENKAPEIFNLQMVDSLQLPPQGQFNVTVLRVQANDPQGLTDVDSVYFNSFLPNDSAATNNPFKMFDDGTSGDSTANDGTYSLTIQIGSNSSTGWYRFYFYARDKVGQLTTGPVDSINVYQ